MERSQWQLLLQQGNDHFHDKQWGQAEVLYSEAYDLLAHSYRNNPVCIETLMAWICTCHNLSSLYESVDKMTLALRFLTVPHEYLLEVTQSEINNEQIKLVAMKGLNLTLPAIVQFSQKHPLCEQCIKKHASLETLLADEQSVIH